MVNFYYCVSGVCYVLYVCVFTHTCLILHHVISFKVRFCFLLEIVYVY